jgi:hypothetical protein
MMSKSLNYAYPRKYAEGGDVAPDTRRRLEFTPSDDSGNNFRYVLYDDKGREAQSGVTQRKYVESGLFGPGTDEKYNVSFLEQAPAPLPPEPETPTVSGSGSGSGLVDPETPTGYQSSDAAPPEQKSTSYAFVDADGNSYSMGDARPGHDGTSLERAIANVQEYYDFAPGSFTVSVPSEKRLVGTYDSGSGSFQAATSDMRDLNGFSALPGEGLMPPFNTEVTTMAMGEEDGGGLMPPFNTEVTTMAMGEEDGGGLMPPPGGGPGEGQLTTMAMGEEEGEGLMPDPPRPPNTGYTPPTPPVVVPPNTGYTPPAAPDAGSFLDFYNDQPPVNAPVFSPGPVAPPVYQPQTQGRTYGAYSGTPMGPTNSIQPFTPYMAPQPAQGPNLQSLITDTDYFLNNSAPRTSVFKRS